MSTNESDRAKEALIGVARSVMYQAHANLSMAHRALYGLPYGEIPNETKEIGDLMAAVSALIAKMYPAEVSAKPAAVGAEKTTSDGCRRSVSTLTILR